MMFHNDLVAATLADLDREIAAGALARTLTTLYGPCRCGRQASRPERRPAAPCAFHDADPGLFRRLVWSGLGS